MTIFLTCNVSNEYNSLKELIEEKPNKFHTYYTGYTGTLPNKLAQAAMRLSLQSVAIITQKRTKKYKTMVFNGKRKRIYEFDYLIKAVNK